ncbi:AaceriAGR352Cp [[Ashbya] aceris (nom. inval.)]|nr:AaceriAGR352Cp [[Ashbya] aceris (nom. inval.)]
MSDPFANLLTKFKGKEKPHDAQKSKSTSLNDLLAQNSVSSLPDSPATLYNPKEIKPPAASEEVQRELSSLLGATGGVYEGGQSNLSTEAYRSQSLIDFEDAQPHPAASVSSFEDRPAAIADQEQDFELAKLMSLGLDIDEANDCYNKGVTSEDLRMRQAEAEEARLCRSSDFGRGNDFGRDSDFGRGSFGRGSDFGRNSDFARADRSEIPQWSTLRSDRSRSNRLVSAASNLFTRGRDFIEDQLATHTRTSASSTSTLSDNNERPSNRTSESSSSVNQTHDQAPLMRTQQVTTEIDLLDGFDDEKVVQPQSMSEVPPLQVASVKSGDSLIDFASEGTSKPSTALKHVPISTLELSGYQDFNQMAAASYKKGDYHTACQDYIKSLNTLPLAHPLRIIALSNIVTTQIKIGEHSESMKNINLAIQLLQDAPFDAHIQDTSPPRTYKEFWQKIMTRKAELLEMQENYDAALSVYQALISRGYAPKLVLDGKTRCQKACNIQKGSVGPAYLTPKIQREKESTSRKQSPSAAQGKMEELKRVQAQHHEIEKQENERFGLHDKVESRILSWTAGKNTDLRHLLLGLPALLTWMNADQIIASDLVMPKKVKISYLKAISKTHPDKLPRSLGLEEKMIAEHVFITLTKAWEIFKEENGLS